MQRLDTSWADSVLDAILQASDSERAEVADLFDDPPAAAEELAEAVVELLGLAPDELAAWAKTRPDRARFRGAGERLVRVLGDAGVALDPIHAGVLRLELARVVCPRCGHAEEVFTDFRDDDDVCPACWAARP